MTIRNILDFKNRPEDVPSSATDIGNTNSISVAKKKINPSKHWVFTFNNYDVPDIDNIRNSKLIKRFVFQEETGKLGTKHLQGYIEFNTKTRPKKLFSPKIHWEVARDIEASITYCQKEDTRTGKVFSKGFPPPILTINRETLYPWQKELLNIITDNVSERAIYYIFDKIGNVGKSSFCKYLCIEHKALYVSGKSADLKYGIFKYFESNGIYPTLCLLDIPRTQEHISYSALEEVKNGLFFNTKYESQMCIFNSPTLLIFSNHPPEIEKFSKDRWIIKEINNATKCFNQDDKNCQKI